MSVAPPGASGTIIFMGLFGKGLLPWAYEKELIENAAQAKAINSFFIIGTLLVLIKKYSNLQRALLANRRNPMSPMSYVSVHSLYLH
jgi:hypothetical protein